MKTLYRKLFGGNNVGEFATASAVSQIFPIIVAPIISRLYSPEEFGTYGLYYAASTVLSSIATLSLANAILTEKTDADAATAVQTSIAVAAGGTIGLLLLLAAIPAPVIAYVLGDIDQGLLMWLPFNVFLGAASTCTYYWVLRKGRYRYLAINKLTFAMMTASLQVIIGFFSIGALGLILANLVGQALVLALYIAHLSRADSGAFRRPTALALIDSTRRNRQLALFTTPAGLVNSLGTYLPDFFLNRVFGPAVLGQYSLGMRVVGFPLSFVSTIVQDIFRRDASREFADSKRCVRSFRTYFAIMAAFSLIVLIPALFVLDWVFPVVFGSQWGAAANYVQALGALLVIRFISSPLSFIWIITGRQKLDLLWQIGLVVLTVLAFTVPQSLLNVSRPEQSLGLYGIVVGSWYLICLLVSYKWSREAA